MASNKILNIGKFAVVSTSALRLTELLIDRINSKSKTALFFANANFIAHCQSLSSWCNDNSRIVVNDGLVMDLYARAFLGGPFTENLNGTDFVPFFLTGVKAKSRIFLVGGKPGVAERAGAIIERNFGHQIVGAVHGYCDLNDSLLFDMINRSQADILLVALGNPLQEIWIRDNWHRIDATIVIAVGALLDFISGSIPRAPIWVRRIRMEWLFRIIQEPKRLFKRYAIDLFKFICIACRK